MRIFFFVFLFFLLTGKAVPGEVVKPIRGPVPIPESNPSESFRTEKHDQIVPRGHRWEPPVIPHHIKGYQITKNVNACMTCHSRKAADLTGATPVARSHYLDRDGRRLPQVSAQRYFCLQCHAPQFDAPPLVGSSFEGPK